MTAAATDGTDVAGIAGVNGPRGVYCGAAVDGVRTDGVDAAGGALGAVAGMPDCPVDDARAGVGVPAEARAGCAACE